MPFANITAPAQTFQPSFIIPSKTFTEPFQQILNNIDGILTRSERKLLSLMERYCYQDGKIYPKQKTIAFKMSITARQIRRLIKSLREKGFLSVVSSSLVDRHLYGKGNSYHLLNNPAYGQMSGEMSSQNQDHTLLKNYKDIKTKGGFNILSWLKNNGVRHEQSIVDALAALTRRWDKIRFPGLYMQQVVDVQSGNYHAQDHEAQVKQEAQDIPPGTAKLASLIGFSMNRMPEPMEEIDTVERRNRMQNALLNRFG